MNTIKRFLFNPTKADRLVMITINGVSAIITMLMTYIAIVDERWMPAIFFLFLTVLNTLICAIGITVIQDDKK
jgi:hypothetical protein